MSRIAPISRVCFSMASLLAVLVLAVVPYQHALAASGDMQAMTPARIRALAARVSATPEADRITLLDTATDGGNWVIGFTRGTAPGVTLEMYWVTTSMEDCGVTWSVLQASGDPVLLVREGGCYRQVGSEAFHDTLFFHAERFLQGSRMSQSMDQVRRVKTVAATDAALIQRAQAMMRAMVARDLPTIERLDLEQSREDRATEEAAPTASQSMDAVDWNAGPGYTVVLSSELRQDRALEIMRKARAEGINAGVLWSSDFSSLRAGFWVVYAGRFSDVKKAGAAQAQLRARGYKTAYARFITR